MKTLTNKQSSGFTIIEVVLVLAIAGLIFLMIFIALPALQRSQRDSQRRNDIGTFVTQLQQYSTNNRGELPDPEDTDDINDFARDYLKWTPGTDGEFKDPKTGKGYEFELSSEAPVDSTIVYGGPNTKCNGEKIESAGGNERQGAVAVDLEGGGAFCQSVQ